MARRIETVTAALTVALAAACVVPTTAQPADESLLGGEPIAGGVYVRDSSEAVDRFALAERLAGLGEWAEAAEVYRVAADQLGDRLVAARGINGDIYQYRPVVDAVRRRLSEWPAEGREAYRTRYGGEASRALETARTLPAGSAEREAALQQLVRRDFPTAAAVSAGFELIDRHIAAGRASEANRLATMLLDDHADLTPGDRAALLFRAVASAKLAGDATAASELADALSADYPNATATLGGQDTNLSAAAASLVEAPAPPDATPRDGTWPTFAGNSTRNRTVDMAPGEVTPIWTLSLPEPDLPGEQVRATVRRSYDADRRQGQMTGIFPAVYDDTAYWTDNVRVYALGLDSRLPPPGWLATYPGDLDGPPGVATLSGGGWMTPRGTVLAPLVTEDRLYVPLGERDEALADKTGGGSAAPAQLVCFNRSNGAQLWESRPSNFAREELPELSDEDFESLADCRFVGVPLEASGTLWSLAKTEPRRVRQFEEAWLIGLDPRTGRPTRAIHLATSMQAQLRYQQNLYVPEASPPLSAAGGLIFAPTGRGVLAAVSATDGRVRWVDLYERNEAEVELVNGRARRFRGARDRFPRRVTQGQPFHVSPPIVTDNRIFYRPPDAEAILIYDVETGERIGRLPTSSLLPGEDDDGAEGDEVRSLLAAKGDRLYALGSNSVFFLNWRNILADVEAGQLDDEARFDWVEGMGIVSAGPASAPGSAPTAPERLLGRPALTDTHVILPSPQGLALIDLETSERDDSKLGPDSTWSALPTIDPFGVESGVPADELDRLPNADVSRLGNIIVVGERVLVAGPSTVSLFADRNAVRRRLESMREAAPLDPEPLVRLAELRFAGGDWQEAVALLKEAATLNGGADFAHEVALSMLRAQERHQATDDKAEATAELLAVAQEFASTPAQQVAVRFARVRSGTDPEASLTAMQEVLAEANWRAVALPGGVRARDAARGEIARIIREGGDALYAKIETRAAEALADAGDDAAALRRIVDIYPNSDAAAEALNRLADVQLAAGRLPAARTALRELRFNALATDSDETAAQATLRLAEVEARRGRFDLAAARLLSTSRVDTDATVGERFEDVPASATVTEAAEALAARAIASDAENIPDLNLPSEPTAPAMFDADAAVTIDGVLELLPIEDAARRFDRVVTMRRGNELAVYKFGEAEPLWRSAAGDVVPRAAAWDGDELLAWGPSGVARFNAEGERLWFTPAVDAAVEESPLAMASAPVRQRPSLVSMQLEAQLNVFDLTNVGNDGGARLGAALRELRDAARDDQLRVVPRDNGAFVQFIAGDRLAELHVYETRGMILLPGRGFVQPLRRRSGVPAPEPSEIVDSFVNAVQPASTGHELAMAAPCTDGVVAITSGPGGSLSLSLVDGTSGDVRWTTTLPSGWPVGLSVAGDHLAVRIEESVQGGDTNLLAHELLTGSRTFLRRFGAAPTERLYSFKVMPTNDLIVIDGMTMSAYDLDRASKGSVRQTAGMLSQDAEGGDRPALRATYQPPAEPRQPVPFESAGVRTVPGSLTIDQQWLGDPTGGRLATVGLELIVAADPRQDGRHDGLVLHVETLRPRSVPDTVLPLTLIGDAEDPAELREDELPGWEQRRRQLERQRAAGRNSGESGWPGERFYVVGDRVYLGGRRGLWAHDLSAPAGSVGPIWQRDNHPLDQLDNAVLLDVVVAEDFAIAVDAPRDQKVERPSRMNLGGRPATLRLIPFSRFELPDGRESGLLHRTTYVGNGQSGIAGTPERWQGQDGGLAILTDAGQLTFLPGAGG